MLQLGSKITSTVANTGSRVSNRLYRLSARLYSDSTKWAEQSYLDSERWNQNSSLQNLAPFKWLEQMNINLLVLVPWVTRVTRERPSVKKCDCQPAHKKLSVGTLICKEPIKLHSNCVHTLCVMRTSEMKEQFLSRSWSGADPESGFSSSKISLVLHFPSFFLMENHGGWYWWLFRLMSPFPSSLQGFYQRGSDDPKSVYAPFLNLINIIRKWVGKLRGRAGANGERPPLGAVES